MPRPCQIAAILTLLVLGLNAGPRAAFATDLPVIPKHSTLHRHEPAAKVRTGLRLEEFAQGPNAACTAWTDGCRTCGRNPDGIHCSNVGIACLPSEPRCTRP